MASTSALSALSRNWTTFRCNVLSMELPRGAMMGHRRRSECGIADKHKQRLLPLSRRNDAPAQAADAPPAQAADALLSSQSVS